MLGLRLTQVLLQALRRFGVEDRPKHGKEARELPSVVLTRLKDVMRATLRPEPA